MTQEELLKEYTLEKVLETLPAELIISRKKWFYAHEVYDLVIRKENVFNLWAVEYYNDKMVKTYFRVQNHSLHVAAVKMLMKLIEEDLF